MYSNCVLLLNPVIRTDGYLDMIWGERLHVWFILGFPWSVLQEDVDAYMADPENDSAEKVLKRLEEQHQKYKFMESHLVTKKFRYLT